MPIDHDYFGGINAFTKTIRRLEARSFPDLVTRYFDQAVSINMTRQAYLDLPKPDRDRVKSVAYLTPCSFKDIDAGRNDANADALQLAFFDIDTGDLSRQVFSAPQTVADQLGDLNFVLHTTANHTPDKPRLRLVVDIEEMPLTIHRPLIAHIASLLGVTQRWEGIRESMVLSQPMYRPVVFQGDTPSPILCSRTTGRALTQAEIPPLTEQQQDEADRRYAADFDGLNESLEYLPLAVSLEEVKEALMHISADCSYEVWTHIASALRHQFRDEASAEEAFELYDEWSETATVSYPTGGSDAVYAKWRSFRPYPVGRAPVTIRSLFKYAMDAGWSNAPLVEKLSRAFDEWLEHATSAATVLSEFAARIAGMPFPSKVQDAALCDRVCKRYNTLAKAKLTSTTFLKQLREDSKVSVLDNADDKPPWLRPFVYVASDNKFFNTTNMFSFAPEAFDRYHGQHLMPDEIEVGAPARPLAAPSDYAVNVKEIPRVMACVYDPRHAGTEPIFVKGGNPYLNTYQASYPEPDARTSEEAGRILTAHLARLIAEPEYQRTLLDFLAHLPQFPGVKIRWAPVIQSVMGGGKGLIAKAMEGVLGRGNVKPVSNNIIASQWNDWAAGAQLIVMEEIHVSGQNRKAVMDSLKELITNDDLPINKRNCSAAVVDNIANVICFTNEEQALAVSAQERRYFVLKSPLRSKAQVDALKAEGVYIELARLHGDLAGGLRHFLLNHKISPDFDKDGNAPSTTYQQEMAEDAENPILSMIQQLMDDDTHPLLCKQAIAISALIPQLGKGLEHSRPSRFLRELGYVKHAARARLGRTVSDVWVPRGWDSRLDDCPVELLRERERASQDGDI